MTDVRDLLDRVSAPEGEGRPIHDPATGEVIGNAPEATVEELDAAIARARAAQPAWEALGHQARSAALGAAAAAVDARAEELARLLSREQGKPLNGPNARFELGACSAWLRTNATTPLEPEVLVDDDSGHAELVYKAIGVVGAIGPWNWPLMIAIWQIGPSLRMGNTVVVKPSEYTPLSVLAMISVMNDVLPADADARGPALLVITEQGRVWDVRQIIDDPDGNHDWSITARVDLDECDEAGELVVRTLDFARLDG